MNEFITWKSIPNKVTAKAVHTELRKRGASSYEFGLLYREILSHRLWPSQASLAKELDVSASLVSQQLALARLPPTVVRQMGGPAHISRRVGQAILSTIDTCGVHVFETRAQTARDVGYTSIEDLLYFVVTNKLPERDKSVVRVRISRNNKMLLIETPIAARIKPHIEKLERHMSSVLQMFEQTVRAEAAEALRVRNARLRK